MKVLKFGVCLILIGMVLFATLIPAEDAAIRESKRNDFDARLEHIMCRIDLTKTQLDLFSSVNSSLISYKAVLDEDLTRLKQFADEFNQKEFGNYVTTTFKNNLRKAVVAVRSTKTDFRRSNLTQEEKRTLAENHRTAIAEFAECINEADENFAEMRGSYLGAWINKWNKIIEKMKENGYDTSEMENVVQEADSKLPPAIEKIKTGNGGGQRRAMQDARNLHLHLWAKFEIARMRAYLDFIEEEAIDKGYKQDVTIIKNKLSSISTLAVSGKKYGPGEFEVIWRTIKETSDLLKELNRKL